MTDIIDTATTPIVAARRHHGHLLEIECPFCRTRKGKGKPKFHTHGTGGEAGVGLPGPWGHRLAHCVDADLSPELRKRRNEVGLGYYLVEVSDQRVIDAPPLVPLSGHPVEGLVCDSEGGSP